MIKKVVIGLVVLVLLLIGLAQFPHWFIKQQFNYRGFVVYSNAEIQPDEPVQAVFDAVQANLEESVFASSEDQFHLFFIRGTMYEKLIRAFGRRNMAFAKGNRQVYSAWPDFAAGTLHRNNNAIERMHLVQVITHESVHSQMYRDYARFGFLKTPGWINEGYAEYISYGPVRKQGDYRTEDLLLQLQQ